MKRTAVGKEVASLQALLARYGRHPRRSIIENVIPAEMLKGRARKALAGLTFADISLDGGFGLAARAGVQAGDIKALIEVLDKLLEGDQTAQLPSINSEFEDVDSGFAQIELSRALDTLIASGALERIGAKLLREYWEKDWPRAPFEEVLSFKQLAGLDLSSLLKKRAFTAEKMLAVSKAIDRAVAASAHSKKPEIGASNNHAVVFEAVRFQGSHQTSFLAVCTRAAYENAAQIAPNSAFGALLRAIVGSNHPDAVIAALVSASMPTLAAGALLQLAPQDLSDLTHAGRSEIYKLAQTSAAGLLAQLDAALLAPAVSEQMLLSTVACSEVASILQLAIVRVLLEVGTAKNPLIFGQRLNGFWTKSERNAELLLRGVMAGLPKAEAELLKELADLIAGIEPAVLVEAILRGGARRDKRGMITLR